MRIFSVEKTHAKLLKFRGVYWTHAYWIGTCHFVIFMALDTYIKLKFGTTIITQISIYLQVFKKDYFNKLYIRNVIYKKRFKDVNTWHFSLTSVSFIYEWSSSLSLL